MGQVTSSNVPAGGAAAAAAAQPAATSSTVGSASVISSGPQTAAQVPTSFLTRHLIARHNTERVFLTSQATSWLLMAMLRSPSCV